MPDSIDRDPPHATDRATSSPSSPRVTIGIDYGRARCGVAISDELGKLAHPRPFVDARDRRRLVRSLAEAAAREHARRFVVGLPLDMSGREGVAAEQVRVFARELARASGLEVVLWDERLSTVEAARGLRDAGLDARAAREHIDSAAAATILQSYLDARRKAARERRAERAPK